VRERRVFFVEVPVFDEGPAAVRCPRRPRWRSRRRSSSALRNLPERGDALQERLAHELLQRVQRDALWYHTPLAVAFTGASYPVEIYVATRRRTTGMRTRGLAHAFCRIARKMAPNKQAEEDPVERVDALVMPAPLR
jgi:hypothetical protein